MPAGDCAPVGRAADPRTSIKNKVAIRSLLRRRSCEGRMATGFRHINHLFVCVCMSVKSLSYSWCRAPTTLDKAIATKYLQREAIFVTLWPLVGRGAGEGVCGKIAPPASLPATYVHVDTQLNVHTFDT